MAENFFRILDDRIASGDLDEGARRRMQHPWCQECQAEYRKKFPGRNFGIKCEGIYSMPDFEQIAKENDTGLHEVREIYDLPYWAKNHYKVTDARGNFVPFDVSGRPYQEKALRCTASRTVDRWARGLGKTTRRIIRTVHDAITYKNYPILTLAPAQHQADVWYREIERFIESDDELRGCVVQKRQAPFFLFKLSNGSTISIFTAGSKSGRGADSIRSQSPREIVLEEQDLLNEKDYAAISPLFDRYTDDLGVRVNGSSTPLGKRETYWEMCTKWPDMKEFHFPIMHHPDWGAEKEEKCRRECRTEIRYTHEMLAEFGDQEAGVFKSVYVDASRQPYLYRDCRPDPNLRYWMGVDWNGQGTGTRIRVVEFNPATSKRRMVDKLAIDESNVASINAIRAMNRKWGCEGICVDAGFGGTQGELLQLLGAQADPEARRRLNPAEQEVLEAIGRSGDPADRVLRKVQVIDFGANLKFNKLVPNRGNTRYVDDQELERRTKPFMVEGAVMCLEGGLFEFSADDSLLDEQFRAYVVKSWSQHGWANTYDGGNVGDHDLDAAMLALLGIELRYGIFYRANARPATAASLSMVSGFGQQSVQVGLFDRAAATVEKRSAEKAAAGIPSRQASPLARIAASAGKTAAMMRGNAFVIAARPSLGRAEGNAVPSRAIPVARRAAPGYGGGGALPYGRRSRMPL
jgi:replicative DNA helicase